MYRTEILKDFLAKEPIVEERPIEPHDIWEVKSILVVMTQGLGDHLLILPLLRTLRKRYPSAKIGVLCRKEYSVFYDMVDEVIGIGEWSTSSYELVINLNPSNEKLEKVISLFNPKIKVGLKEPNDFGYDFPVEDYLVSRAVHYINFLKIVGISKFDMDFKIDLKKESLEKFNIDESKKIICLCIGSSDPRKCWSPKKYADLIGYLQDYRVVLLGKNIFSDEGKIGDTLSKTPNVTDLINKTTVAEAGQILNTSDLVISNDNGLMHLAAALDKKIIALFGPTNPAIWGPNSSKAVVLNVTKEGCGKKDSDYCNRNDCGRCINNINVKDIVNLIKL